MRTRYLGILAFTLLTGVIFAAAFHFLGARDAVGDQRTAVMVVATFALAMFILSFRFLTAGGDWDPPGDVAFTATALVLMSLLIPWGVWLLIAAIPAGGLVTFFRMIRVVQTKNARSELTYTAVLFSQFVLILTSLAWLGIR